MQRFGNPILSLAAPFLILISIMGLFQRQGSERWHALPALVVGSGLIVSGAVSRRLRREKLLLAIRNRTNDE